MIGSVGGSWVSVAASYGNGGMSASRGTPVKATDTQTTSTTDGQAGSVALSDVTSGELTPAELEQIKQLKQLDRKVRAHELAHVAAGAGLVRGGVSYTYATGPDNQRYAVGGEVSISTAAGRTPEETVSKAQRIRAAALAPADPSSQDRSVAAEASRMEAEARAEIAMQRQESFSARSGSSAAPGGDTEGRAAISSYRQQGAGASEALGARVNLFA